jgi:hypothetical protein
MKAYATNIVWEYNELTITDEQIKDIPTRVELLIDPELCESKEDIETFYMEDVDKECSYAQCNSFDISFLGYNLDVEETITTKEHFQSVKQSIEEWEGYNEIAEWDRQYNLP